MYQQVTPQPQSSLFICGRSRLAPGRHLTSDSQVPISICHAVTCRTKARNRAKQKHEHLTLASPQIERGSLGVGMRQSSACGTGMRSQSGVANSKCRRPEIIVTECANHCTTMPLNLFEGGMLGASFEGFKQWVRLIEVSGRFDGR